MQILYRRDPTGRFRNPELVQPLGGLVGMNQMMDCQPAWPCIGDIEDGVLGTPRLFKPIQTSASRFSDNRIVIDVPSCCEM